MLGSFFVVGKGRIRLVGTIEGRVGTITHWQALWIRHLVVAV